MQLFTIGFTQKTARRFFELLSSHQVGCLVDIRIHPGSQLSGFAKQSDLGYFLKALNNCEYRHLLDLAPTEDMMSVYRKSHDWEAYAQAFESLLDARHVPETLDRTLFESQRCCLLCSEPTPEQCHRRLVAERLQKHWSNVEIIHLI